MNDTDRLAEFQKILATMERNGTPGLPVSRDDYAWLVERANRIARALDFADSGQVDGEHHKAWAIDQMVRALLACPIVTRTATDHRGWSYDYEAQGESEEYRRFVAEYRAGEDGPETYTWDEGIPP